MLDDTKTILEENRSYNQRTCIEHSPMLVLQVSAPRAMCLFVLGSGFRWAFPPTRLNASERFDSGTADARQTGTSIMAQQHVYFRALVPFVDAAQGCLAAERETKDAGGRVALRLSEFPVLLEKALMAEDSI